MALTIRAGQEFENELEKLKGRLDIKTGTGVIKYLVDSYGCMADDLADTRRELALVKQQLGHLLDLQARKENAEIELTQFLIKLNTIE